MAPLVLHVWPGRWGLPSIDASCLEAIIYLQLALPGHYSIVETADPDQSPSGQLPFLTHGQIIVSPSPSIISYVSSLNHALLKPSDFQDEYEIDPSMVTPNLDAGLSALQLSQRTAWRAYFEAQLGDLVVS
jgi:sorting and assembly machinery component 37